MAGLTGSAFGCAGCDRRPQSACRRTPYRRGALGWGRRGSIRPVRSVRYGSPAPSPTSAARPRPASTGSRASPPSKPAPGSPTPPGPQVWLKREDLQVGRSYKLRGAYNLLAQLGRPSGRPARCAPAPATTARAWPTPAATLGMHGRVYVPRTTPRQKRERIAALGGDGVELVVDGDTYDDAAAAAAEYAARTGATLVPAFDDPRTIAGQGTVGIEIVEQLGRAPDVVVVPVGGGGLLAGVATWLREQHPGGPGGRGRAGGRGEHDRRAGRRRAGRRCPSSTPSSTAPPCAGSARSRLPMVARQRRGAGRRARGPGVHRDAGPLPGRRDHRRARGRAGRRPRWATRSRSSPGRRSCACSPAATTT